MGSECYVIWSEEHGAWWQAKRLGYTRSLVDAGRYTWAEAELICKEANRYLVPSESPPFNEIAIADPMESGE